METKVTPELVDELDKWLVKDKRWGKLEKVRLKLLKRNEQYNKEKQELTKYQDKHSKKFHKKLNKFSIKWGLGRLPMDFGGPIVSLVAEGSSYLTVKVDLRYPKTRITEITELAVRVAHDIFYHTKFMKWFRESFLKGKDYPLDLQAKWLTEIMEYSGEWSEELKPVFEEFCRNEMKEKLPPHYFRKLQEPELYEMYIQVWDLKEREGKSWSKITDELNLNSIQTARNYHKAACKLIKEGIPGYQLFPTC